MEKGEDGVEDNVIYLLSSASKDNNPELTCFSVFKSCRSLVLNLTLIWRYRGYFDLGKVF